MKNASIDIVNGGSSWCTFHTRRRSAATHAATLSRCITNGNPRSNRGGGDCRIGFTNYRRNCDRSFDVGPFLQTSHLHPLELHLGCYLHCYYATRTFQHRWPCSPIHLVSGRTLASTISFHLDDNPKMRETDFVDRFVRRKLVNDHWFLRFEIRRRKKKDPKKILIRGLDRNQFEVRAWQLNPRTRASSSLTQSIFRRSYTRNTRTHTHTQAKRVCATMEITGTASYLYPRSDPNRAGYPRAALAISGSVNSPNYPQHS